MYTTSGVAVIDRFPLRKVDEEGLDSIASSMEEGILYILVVQGKDDYASPFTFQQVVGWVSDKLNGPRIVIVDLDLSKGLNTSNSNVLEVSNTLSKLEQLPHREPLSELCCFYTNVSEDNPYVIGIAECFQTRHEISIELPSLSNDIPISRKALLEKALKVDDMEHYFSLFTPKSYRSVKYYKDSILSN